MRTSSIHTAYRSAIGVALVTAFILLLPLLAMQITEEVVWDLADFAVASALLLCTGLTYELVAKKMDRIAYRVAIGVALAAAFILIWVALAVGIIGSIIARFQPHGMARALLATAIAQALVATIVLIAGLGSPQSGPGELLMLNGFFVALFVGLAWLFRHAAHRRLEQRAI